MKGHCLFVALLAGLVLVSGKVAAQVTLETDCLRYVIGADGRNVSFIDKASGMNYCDAAAVGSFARVRKGGQAYEASAVSFENGQLTVAFGDSSVRAVIRVEALGRYFTLEVVSVSDEAVEEFAFVDVALKLKGKLDEPFAGCALALNLQTNVPENPGPNPRLRASCYKRFGMTGAKVAIIGCPQAALRDVMKDVVRAAKDLPQSDIGGPFALDGPINRGSYLFDFGQLTETTVDSWIVLAKQLGITQIDFHTGGSLRFGDCHPNPTLFPRGRDSVKAVLDKLHAAGISAGLHTYAFFLAKNTPYVTPVPDPRLGKDAVFTLAEALSADANAVPVVESTERMSALTGFFLRNSATLHIDNELITYTGVSKEAPFVFTGCTRGAYGTTAAAHAQGAKAGHLKECFGLFAPDADSTLLTEVAQNTADTFNECGFDMIYLDALDGEDILAGGENAWHYGSKFVFEIAKRLKKPALFEMSTFHHHLWYVRARMGAWDHPTRSHKRFIDLHCAANRDGAGMFLPMNLGWWAVMNWSDGVAALQTEPTFADDIEYLMCKCLGNDMGFALMGVNPDNLPSSPAYQRLAPIFRQYEALRLTNYFPESIKAKLRAPGDEFTLEQAADGKWRFRPVRYDKHKVQGMDGWSNTWSVKNPFGQQPLQLRIEALMSVQGYDSPDSVVVEDFSKPDGLTDRACADGVTAGLQTATEPVKVGAASGCLTATSNRPGPAGAWAKVGRTCEPPLSIPNQPGLGVWVHGDGQGELLNLQLRSPEYTGTGGLGDHYVTVDFTGWRYFELVELEGGHIEDYTWPYGGSYAVYRENVDFGHVASFSLWYNNLPSGKPVTCYLSPIKALPLVKAKVRNPKITLAGKTLTFPVEIETGCYIEFRSLADCKLYGPKGELLGDVTPQGDVPALEAGENRLQFECEAAPEVNARARVTVITRGEPVQE